MWDDSHPWDHRVSQLLNEGIKVLLVTPFYTLGTSKHNDERDVINLILYLQTTKPAELSVTAHSSRHHRDQKPNPEHYCQGSAGQASSQPW